MAVSKKAAKKGPAIKPTKTGTTKKTGTVAKPDFKAQAAGERQESAEPKRPSAAPKREPAEQLGEKLRSKAEIMGALKKGGVLFQTPERLFRVRNADGSVNRCSKRRANAMISTGVVKATKVNGETQYVLDPEAKKEENTTK